MANVLHVVGTATETHLRARVLRGAGRFASLSVRHLSGRVSLSLAPWLACGMVAVRVRCGRIRVDSRLSWMLGESGSTGPRRRIDVFRRPDQNFLMQTHTRDAET